MKYSFMFYNITRAVTTAFNAFRRKSGELIQNCGKYRVNIILDDKTLQYFHVPIAYQIQQNNL